MSGKEYVILTAVECLCMYVCVDRRTGSAAPKLPSLLKMLVWAQNRLSEKANFPKINNLQTAELEDSQSAE